MIYSNVAAGADACPRLSGSSDKDLDALTKRRFMSEIPKDEDKVNVIQEMKEYNSGRTSVKKRVGNQWFRRCSTDGITIIHIHRLFIDTFIKTSGTATDKQIRYLQRNDKRGGSHSSCLRLT